MLCLYQDYCLSDNSHHSDTKLHYKYLLRENHEPCSTLVINNKKFNTHCIMIRAAQRWQSYMRAAKTNISHKQQIKNIVFASWCSNWLSVRLRLKIKLSKRVVHLRIRKARLILIDARYVKIIQHNTGTTTSRQCSQFSENRVESRQI